VVSNKCSGRLLIVDFSSKEEKYCRVFVWPLLQCHKGISYLHFPILWKIVFSSIVLPIVGCHLV
jgi:hypothetical protein